MLFFLGLLKRVCSGRRNNMSRFVLLIGLFLLFVVFLVAESVYYNRRLYRISLRISVSGTRGKSSIVRTLASVLREHGITVLAKTTGSEATFILPDGSTQPIKRKGLTTVLEQKRLIFKTARLNADCVITEIMSIHPENHVVETHKLIRPAITILSNFRADHTDVAGDSIDELSALFINDIYPGSKVFIPEKEINEFIIKGIEKNKARLIPAITGTSDELNLNETVCQMHISANLDVVVATARYLRIPDETIVKGITNTRLDIGKMEIFTLHSGIRKIWFVNAFAANDPLSTRLIMEKTLRILAPEITAATEIIGLLALRNDRGERSRQWLDYLLADGKNMFSHTFVSGIHSPVFTRKLNHCEKLVAKKPAEITRKIIASTSGDIVAFGIMNIHGLGMELIEYWKTGLIIS